MFNIARSSTFLAAIVVVAVSCFGQWAPAGVPFNFITSSCIYADSVTDAVYVLGESSLNNDNVLDDAALPVYTNGQWDTIAFFDRGPLSMVRYGETLVFGGNFGEVNGLSIETVAGFHGGTWAPFGELERFTLLRLREIDGDIYAVGGFTESGGVGCPGVARWVDGEWQPVGCLPDPEPIVTDIVSWNGRLCITGVFDLGPPGTPRNIAYLDANEDWVPIGPGLLGSIAAGRSLAVYEDDLYVSGSIPIQAGNAGHGIMRWDGEQFHAVGTGIQGLDNDYTYAVGSHEMEVYNGLLWAAGTFSYAGHVPAPGIATWDGSQWCGLPLGPEPEINSIEFFHDTLFASCFHNLNGVDVNCAVRYTGDVYADTCALPVNVPDRRSKTSPMRAFRRVEGGVALVGLPVGVHSLALQDASGKLVWEGSVHVAGEHPSLVDIPVLSAGMYMFRIGTVGAVRFLGP